MGAPANCSGFAANSVGFGVGAIAGFGAGAGGASGASFCASYVIYPFVSLTWISSIRGRHPSTSSSTSVSLASARDS